MKSIIDLNFHRKTSFKCRLGQLYSRMDHIVATENMDTVTKKNLCRANLGKFLKIFRESKHLSISEVSEKSKISLDRLTNLEEGKSEIPSSMLFRIYASIGAIQELDVFLEKMEECLNPNLKKSRRELAPTLLSYGLRFVDKDKYQSDEKGQVLVFQPLRP